MTNTEYVEPAVAAEPDGRLNSLVIRLFGAPSVAFNGKQLSMAASRKGLWLLALLALHAADKPIERVWLAANLWPDNSEPSAQFYLRRTLVFLRQTLGPGAQCISKPTARTLSLDITRVDCDLITFNAAIRRGDTASLRLAVNTYREPLLLGCTEDWAIRPREVCEGAALQALETLADRATAAGDFSESIRFLRRALELDPLRETAVRSLMDTFSARNDSASAIEAFRVFRERLHRELGVNPDPRTSRIYQDLVVRNGFPDRLTATRHQEHATVTNPNSALQLPNTALIGRERECAAVVRALTNARLVTLTGPGGIGKTRLAIAAAQMASDVFPDGAHFVHVSPLGEPSLLAAAVLEALGRRPASDAAPPMDALIAYLKSRRALIVLDNCEHLLGACAELSGVVVSDCPDAQVLATSREPLHVRGEVVWRVPSLVEADAESLFLERAKRAGSVVEKTVPTSGAIGDICRRLDGIPLAIEMAAAWMRAMTAPQIAARLEDTFRLLKRPEGGQPIPRQQTLRATLDWSYDLLGSGERTLLSELSVFVGGWTLEAAEAVCTTGDSVGDVGVLERLFALVDKSLVVYWESPDMPNGGRYRLLETTRAYAAEMLAPGVGDPVAYRHAAYFLRVAEAAKRSWGGAEEGQHLTLLDIELPNIRAALAWGLTTTWRGIEDGAEDSAGQLTPAVLAMRLSATLMRFWKIRGLLIEGRHLLERALAIESGPMDASTRALALNACGGLASLQRDMDFALRCHDEALRIRTGIDDKRGMAVSLVNICRVQQALGDIPAARQALESARALYVEIGDTRQAENMRQMFATLDPNRLSEYEGVLLARLATAESAGDQRTIAEVCGHLGLVYQRQENDEESCRCLRRGLAIIRTWGDRIAIAQAFEALAPAMALADGGRAVPRLYGAASKLRQETQSPIPPTNREPYEQNSAAARALLGDSGYETAFEDGRSWSLPQAIDYAMTASPVIDEARMAAPEEQRELTPM